MMGDTVPQHTIMQYPGRGEGMGDLTEGLKKLAVLEQSLHGTVELSHSSATISGISSQKSRITRENMAEGARFELADPLRGLQFSRLARSATPSPLHNYA